MNTPQLIRRCQSGDEAAIDELLKTYNPALYCLAYSILLNAEDAEEAVQDAFIAALKSLEDFKGEALKPWLYGITLNHCRMKLRRRKALDRLNSVLQTLFRVTRADPAHPEISVIATQTSAFIWQRVCSLDEKHRMPVVLYYYHDLPVAEIAQLLQVNEGTVHSRLFVARERLREAFYGKIEMEENLDPVNEGKNG